MALNISIDAKNFKIYLSVLAGIFVLLIIFILIFTRDSEEDLPKWAERKPQEVSQIEDVRVAMPYVTDNFKIDYLEKQDIFVVTYAGYLEEEIIEIKVITFFSGYPELKDEKIRIKYGGIGGIIEEYDLSKELSEILTNNKYINDPSIDPNSVGKS